MAKVPHGVETLWKISIAWVGCTNVTDDRRQTDGRTMTYSERERESSRSLKSRQLSFLKEAAKLWQQLSASVLVLRLCLSHIMHKTYTRHAVVFCLWTIPTHRRLKLHRHTLAPSRQDVMTLTSRWCQATIWRSSALLGDGQWRTVWRQRTGDDGFCAHRTNARQRGIHHTTRTPNFIDAANCHFSWAGWATSITGQKISACLCVNQGGAYHESYT